MKKSELNQNITIAQGNTKLRDTEDTAFLIFNITARKTCPYRTEICDRICLSRDPQEIFKDVLITRDRNFEESKKDTFVNDMINHIEYHLTRKKYINKHIIFRWHESGDLYNQEYTNKVISIGEHFIDNDKISFQLYTKSLPYLKEYNINKLNTKILFSVMPDTKQSIIDEAVQIGLSLFIVKPANEININNFICKMDCGSCKECYKKDGEKNIYCAYHGARIPRIQKFKKEPKPYFKKKDKTK
jgi:hypothetical protein